MKVGLVYAGAALFEIIGCVTVWEWSLNGRPIWWLVPGIAALLLFAWLLTMVPTDAAGRAFAAYGGVYIASSVLWLWLYDRQSPTIWDLVGAAICVLGAVVILLGNRA